MPTTGNVTQNEINVTLQAQQAFQEAVTALNSIVSSVLDAKSQLTTTAMVTTAGAAYGNAVVAWCEDFDDIRTTMQFMSDQLGQTAQQLQKGNQENADQASSLLQGLPNFGGVTTASS